MGIFEGAVIANGNEERRKKAKDNIKTLYDSIKEQDDCANSLDMVVNTINDDDSCRGNVRYEIERAARIIHFKSADDTNRFVEAIRDYGPVAIRTNFINRNQVDGYGVFVPWGVVEKYNKAGLDLASEIESFITNRINEYEKENKKKKTLNEVGNDINNFMKE